MPKVSVCIPSYNEGMALIHLLEGLGYQRLSPNVQIEEAIISDDSHDDTPELIRSYLLRARSFPIEFYHHDERRGVAEAWNELLRKAKGDVVILFDADVILHPNTVDRLVRPFLEDEKTGLVAPKILPLKPRSYLGGASYLVGLVLQRLRSPSSISQLTVQGRGLALSRTLAKAFSLPKHTIAVDLYVLCKAVEQGYRVKVAEDALVFFRPAESLYEFASQTLRAVVGHRQLGCYMKKVLPKKLGFAEQLRVALKLSKRHRKEASALLLAFLLFPPYLPMVWKGASTYIWEPAFTSKVIDT